MPAPGRPQYASAMAAGELTPSTFCTLSDAVGHSPGEMGWHRVSSRAERALQSRVTHPRRGSSSRDVASAPEKCTPSLALLNALGRYAPVNGMLYCAPHRASAVLIINPVARTLDTTTLAGLSTAAFKWWGIA